MTLPEAGYTPANLRALIEWSGLSQAEAAALVGVEAINMRRWLMDVGVKSHRDMPLVKWRALLAALSYS